MDDFTLAVAGSSLGGFFGMPTLDSDFDPEQAERLLKQVETAKGK
jgi:hypothetical protein